MSCDIDLCLRHPTDHADTIVAGHYPITLARYWRAGLLRPLDELGGQSGLAAAPFLALAARHLLDAGDAYRNHSLAGEHEAATLALVQLWKLCREHPTYILHISCLTTP